MNSPKILNHKYSLFALLSVIIGVAITAFYGIQIYLILGTVNYLNGLTSLIFSFLVSYSIFLVNFPLYNYFQNKFPGQKLLVKRLIFELIFGSAAAALIMSIFVFLFWKFMREQYYQLGRDFNFSSVLFANIYLTVFINFTVYILIEAWNFFEMWKASRLEAEILKRQNIETQYAVLINQINPHFLFNSLNSLTSLIKTSPNEALLFVNKFSKIYRYVLDVREKNISLISDEIDFLNSYLHLQKIRFGNNLVVNLSVDSNYLDSYILPLSLQMLVENAIKHNEISTQFPLTINILAKENFLIISNNLQQRENLEKSTGISLSNIIERYKLLSDLKPEFGIENENYVARIPILTEE